MYTKGGEGILHSSMIPLGLRAILFRTFHFGTRCISNVNQNLGEAKTLEECYYPLCLSRL